MPSIQLPITDPVLIVGLAMAIFLVAPLLLRPLRMPGIIGLLVAGAVVGPNALNLLDRDPTMILLGTVGLLYLLFVAGLELDLHRFAEYRRRSVIFGLVSFGTPMLLSLLIGPRLGFGVAASALVGAIIGSHTLLAYPIVSRMGIVKNLAVTNVLGGTLVTDTLALTVLAVISGTLEGELTAGFLLRLFGILALYVALILVVVPRLGRYFFREAPDDAPAEFIFCMVVAFGAAWLAGVAGAEPIIGAFLAGLTLNRLIPLQSPLMNRIRFIGNALFIPFFLLSVGMLVDVRVFTASADVWILAGALTGMVMAGKAAGAAAVSRIFRYSREEGVVMFGLSVPQAAATLAVTFVGLEMGLFDQAVVNAVIMMILVTGLVGSVLVERFGRLVAFQEEEKPYDPRETPLRILIPVANPETEESLLDIAFMLRGDSDEPIYPLMVVPEAEDGSEARVASAEKMLGHAVVYAAGADVPVAPLTRMDRNVASGIVRAVTEVRASAIVVGWDGRGPRRRSAFGGVLDQLLDQSRQLVIVAKLGHPLNLTRRIVLVVPPKVLRQPGVTDALQATKRIASEQGARVMAIAMSPTPERLEAAFERIRPAIPADFVAVESWGDLGDLLEEELREDDLVVLVSARRGTPAWQRPLERLPSMLARLVPESFLVLYPPEGPPSKDRRRFAGTALPRSLAPRRVVFDLPDVPFESALQVLLRREFAENPQRLTRIAERVAEEVREDAAEPVPGVVLCEAEVEGLEQPLLFLGVSPEGVAFPSAAEPARLVFVLLGPPDREDAMESERAELLAFLQNEDRVRAVAESGSLSELVRASRRGREPSAARPSDGEPDPGRPSPASLGFTRGEGSQ